MDYVTIDFEASCLPRHGLSFPIEVGIADVSGARSWLIQPAAGWTGWDWTTEAAAIHGITLGDLHRDGLPAHRVFAELNRAIAGRDLVADSKLDAYWWRLLAGAAGEDLHAPIRHVAAVLDELDCPSAAVFAAQHYADGLCHARHRAADDALWLWTLLAELRRSSRGAGFDNRSTAVPRYTRPQFNMSGDLAA